MYKLRIFCFQFKHDNILTTRGAETCLPEEPPEDVARLGRGHCARPALQRLCREMLGPGWQNCLQGLLPRSAVPRSFRESAQDGVGAQHELGQHLLASREVSRTTMFSLQQHQDHPSLCGSVGRGQTLGCCLRPTGQAHSHAPSHAPT